MSTSANGMMPASARINERASAAAVLAADPKFRKYTQQVEKCLATFDNVHEWADFIAFLTKLLKTLQSFMQYKEIPRKLIVGKRLAQCLNPALPTGVHQRALDVYSHVLAVLGPEGLKRDLQIWSSGLFPFFQYAATSVKPTLLNIYDTHYLPLQTALRPVMKAFILALLPGLEEETGEFFDKVLSIFDKLSNTVSPAFFIQNLWLVLLTSPVARPPSLNYLSRRFPKLTGQEDITTIVGRDIGLMVRAFSAALEDENLLVRRGILELLVQSFRINSTAFALTQAEDKAILMRAASGVVLRRDLSLNRRLFTWLLGPDEQSDIQMQYFRKYGLELLTLTLKDEMMSPGSSETASRPYKIFISLLDKWEIGSLLTESLILDALRAVKQTIREGDLNEGDDILVTANTLVEAIEPTALWKQLFASVRDELISERISIDAIRLISFVLSKFRTQDDEVLQTHFPVILTALSELITSLIKNNPKRVDVSPPIREGLHLLHQILKTTSIGTLLRPIDIDKPSSTLSSDDNSDPISTPGAYARALRFYGLNDEMGFCSEALNIPAEQPGSEAKLPAHSLLSNVVEISRLCGRGPTERLRATISVGTQECLIATLSLFSTLVVRLEERLKSPLEVEWEPKTWLTVVLPSLAEGVSFELIDKIVTLLVKLSQTKQLRPSLSIDDRSTMEYMVAIALHYLKPKYAPYHVRAVQLIWLLETNTQHRHVESIVSQALTLGERNHLLEPFDAFGVLWRLTDDSLLPGFRFKLPLFIVLDTLRSDDTNTKRIGETWMRCSLKSYLRALEPILFELLDSSIRRSSLVVTYQGREVRGLQYERPFDLHRVQHLLHSLMSLVRFGGQGFGRVIRTTPIKKSYHPGFVARVEAANIAPPSATYMEVLVELLLRFVQAEPKQALMTSMLHTNIDIQAIAIDLLQAIVVRGEVDTLTLDNVEAAVISKLFAAVHTDRLDLQNKLLHLLHSVILACDTATDVSSLSRQKRQETPDPTSSTAEDILPSVGRDDEKAQISAGGGGTVNPLLVQTLVDGISRPSNRPVLQHWIDFILMTVPQFQQSLAQLILPLSDCICKQLRAALLDVARVASNDGKGKGVMVSTTTDADFIMLLNALESLILLSFTKADAEETEDDSASEKAAVESGGLLGMVSNVFGAETSSIGEEHMSSRSPSYRCLHESVRILYAVWLSSSWKPGEKPGSTSESLSLIFSRVRTRCRKVLEKFFRVHSAEVLESIIECYYFRGGDEIPDYVNKADGTFEIIDILSSSAQTVVHMLCESIGFRVVSYPEKKKKLAANPNVSDLVLFTFLEDYFGRLEGPIASQVWGRYITLAKEITSNVHGYKLQVYPSLRCLNALAEKITQTSTIEERRVRRELQDSFSKLVDTCVLISGRSFEQGNWIRRSSAKESLAVSDRASPIPRAQSELNLNERLDSPVVSSDDTTKQAAWGPDLIDQINEFLASKALPNMRRFLVDTDKVASLCTNIVYYIVNPGMKSKTRTVDVDDIILDILGEMSKIPAASKAWRAPVSEAFNDNRFFNGTPASSTKWRPLLKSLMDLDKQSFTELIGRVSSAPSANIFANREYEMLLRSLNLRRLSFVLFSGEHNHFLSQLPAIQEKLVDILRSGAVAPLVVSEVYLCLRVLLCRLSSNNMTSFWPVILTELSRVFEQAMSSPPADNSEELVLVLAACKFLDLILVLQTEESQVHQWMFVTDTVDAVYRPEDWVPEAIMDQLAEIISDLPEARKPQAADDHKPTFPTSVVPNAATSSDLRVGQHRLRKPLLRGVKSISSIRDLVPFFSSVSLSSYESVYYSVLSNTGASLRGANGGIDRDAVESMLLEEMFEGR